MQQSSKIQIDQVTRLICSMVHSRTPFLGSLFFGAGFPAVDPLVGCHSETGGHPQPVAYLLLPWFLATSLEFVEAVSPPSRHR